MSSIFPLRDTVTRDDDREPRLVDLDEETADEVFEALSSETTREIFLALHQSPQTASDLAEATETSVQNSQYHLGKLVDADLVEVVDTWYSERGTEMKVYAPQDDSLVLFAGRDKQGTLQSLLRRFAGLFAFLVPVSILAGLSARWGTDSGESGGVVIDTEETEPATGQTVDVDGGAEADAGEDELFGAEGGSGTDLQGSTTVDGVAVTDDGTAFVFDNETAWEVENATVSELDPGRTAGNETQFVVEGDVAESANETLFVVDGATDPGANASVPPGLVDSAPETSASIAGLDPALAVGGGVLLGGLLVAGSLLAWYGLPGGESDAQASP